MFWSHNKNIDRVEAERNLKLLSVNRIAAQGTGESFESKFKDLRAEIGTVVIGVPRRDEGAFDKLRAIAKGGR